MAVKEGRGRDRTRISGIFRLGVLIAIAGLVTAFVTAGVTGGIWVQLAGR